MADPFYTPLLALYNPHSSTSCPDMPPIILSTATKRESERYQRAVVQALSLCLDINLSDLDSEVSVERLGKSDVLNAIRPAELYAIYRPSGKLRLITTCSTSNILTSFAREGSMVGRVDSLAQGIAFVLCQGDTARMHDIGFNVTRYISSSASSPPYNLPEADATVGPSHALIKEEGTANIHPIAVGRRCTKCRMPMRGHPRAKCRSLYNDNLRPVKDKADWDHQYSRSSSEERPPVIGVLEDGRDVGAAEEKEPTTMVEADQDCRSKGVFVHFTLVAVAAMVATWALLAFTYVCPTPHTTHRHSSLLTTDPFSSAADGRYPAIVDYNACQRVQVAPSVDRRLSTYAAICTCVEGLFPFLAIARPNFKSSQIHSRRWIRFTSPTSQSSARSRQL
ncbi:hypothetical protein C8Q80DRAFT_1124118 [Daedaleopsis nitida]|nr:hypothetical protein C8Q80DRAFT_1124118 [Daedaleopsis nitida]